MWTHWFDVSLLKLRFINSSHWLKIVTVQYPITLMSLAPFYTCLYLCTDQYLALMIRSGIALFCWSTWSNQYLCCSIYTQISLLCIRMRKQPCSDLMNHWCCDPKKPLTVPVTLINSADTWILPDGRERQQKVNSVYFFGGDGPIWYLLHVFALTIIKCCQWLLPMH